MTLRNLGFVILQFTQAVVSLSNAFPFAKNLKKKVAHHSKELTIKPRLRSVNLAALFYWFFWLLIENFNQNIKQTTQSIGSCIFSVNDTKKSWLRYFAIHPSRRFLSNAFSFAKNRKKWLTIKKMTIKSRRRSTWLRFIICFFFLATHRKLSRQIGRRDIKE